MKLADYENGRSHCWGVPDDYEKYGLLCTADRADEIGGVVIFHVNVVERPDDQQECLACMTISGHATPDVPVQ